jgi:hypothetical protein
MLPGKISAATSDEERTAHNPADARELLANQFPAN